VPLHSSDSPPPSCTGAELESVYLAELHSCGRAASCTRPLAILFDMQNRKFGPYLMTIN
jgi:hypothetical protein